MSFKRVNFSILICNLEISSIIYRAHYPFYWMVSFVLEKYVHRGINLNESFELKESNANAIAIAIAIANVMHSLRSIYIGW